MARGQRGQSPRRLGYLARPAVLRHSHSGHRGREVPDVWLDAPIGYLASLKNYCAKRKLDFERLLAECEQVHFIGKDIIYFHTLFWPAMLEFAGAPYKVPDHVYVHGFITVSGDKMSKSRGTGIDPLRYLKLGMNPEWLRYYIAAKLNANVEDIDFNADDFATRVNSDLVGKYINIASRCAIFLSRKFKGEIKLTPGDALLPKFQEALRRNRQGLRSPRVRPGAARSDGARRSRQPVCRSAKSPGSYPRTRRTINVCSMSAPWRSIFFAC